jgi:hypothetical protein
MKNTLKVLSVRVFGIIAIIAIIGFTMIACNKKGGSSGGGGKSFNSAEELKEYLDKQPVNGPDKPIKVSMTINDPMLKSVADVIKSSGKYVSLNITGNALTEIPYGAFENCKTLVGITTPDSITSIVRSFKGCTNLKSITIPDSVTSIADGVFQETPWFDNQPDGLIYLGKVAYRYKGTMPANTNITLLNGTKGIADEAFENCTGLTSITIPNSVTNIGYSAFTGCTGLTSITVDSGNTAYASEGGIVYNKAKTEIVIVPQGLTGNVTIPNGVTGIGPFSGTSIKSVTIPNSVIIIGLWSFQHCTSLTSVTFQGKITSDNLAYNSGETPFDGDLRAKYLAGGPGTYTTTTPVPQEWWKWKPVWTKQ